MPLPLDVSREVYKWKARLNVHGGKQTYGVDYWETYAAALKWSSIRFFLVKALINSWHTRQIDFVLAYPQADVECNLYLEVPQGFEFEVSRKTHCLKLVKNLYGSKAAGRVWQQHLFKGLDELGFVQSGTDKCVFYRGTTTFMIYTYDGIFCGPDEAEIENCLKDLSSKFDITDEGDINEYLGVKVTCQDDGSITLTQPHLIDSIIADLGFRENTKTKATPAPSTASINQDLDGEAHNKSWEYRSVIGKLNFLEKSTRPDIAFAVHQCARYSSNPKESHSAAVRCIVRYLMATRDKGLILRPSNHSFECYVDADFHGGWDIKTATAKSRTAYIIMYGKYPIVWASKMQTDIALSTTESEYSALSEANGEVLWLMGLMTEVKEHLVPETINIPTVRCTVFEDNEGAKAMATVPKMRPRTKHINGRMHHFRGAVASGKLKIESIDTSDQVTDIATKPLAKDMFTRLRREINVTTNPDRTEERHVVSCMIEHLHDDKDTNNNLNVFCFLCREWNTYSCQTIRVLLSLHQTVLRVRQSPYSVLSTRLKQCVIHLLEYFTCMLYSEYMFKVHAQYNLQTIPRSQRNKL